MLLESLKLFGFKTIRGFGEYQKGGIPSSFQGNIPLR
jgi:hypothetical protein